MRNVPPHVAQVVLDNTRAVARFDWKQVFSIIISRSQSLQAVGLDAATIYENPQLLAQ